MFAKNDINMMYGQASVGGLLGLESTNQVLSFIPSFLPSINYALCMYQMSLVDLGKRLLEAARKGEDDEVRTLMANGAPFTTDWVRAVSSSFLFSFLSQPLLPVSF